MSFLMNTNARYLLSALLILVALTLAGCGGGNRSYRIQLKNGSEYSATSEPEFQSKTGYYRYRNLYGKDALLRAEEVLHIERL